jgi:acetyl esterase/lipase
MATTPGANPCRCHPGCGSTEPPSALFPFPIHSIRARLPWFCLLPLCLASALGAGSYPATAGQPIELWPEGIPGYRTGGPAETVQDGWITHVRHPTLIAYRPPAGRQCGTAVVFCPGGGYFHLPTEDAECAEARWLNHLGIAAFVLTYRFGDDGPSAPLRDVLRAVRLIRSHAADYGVRSDRIGILGASAGGHVAAAAATLCDDPDGRTGSPLDRVSGRPDFTVLLYPVITMREPFVHRGSRRGLLGADPSPTLVDHFSTELHVTKDTPPAFLVSTEEDKSVPLENSVAYFAALRKAGVAAEMHLFERGPHGFKFTQGLGPTSDWPARCEDWLRFHGWIPAAPKT